MNNRKFLAASCVLAAMTATAAHGAESAKASPSPAPAAHPSAPGGGAGRSANAPADHSGNAGRGAVAERRAERRAARTVYVPGYGYSNWYGDYTAPYWNTPGTWYANGDTGAGQQPASTPGDPAAPIPPARAQEDAARAEMIAARARVAGQFETADDIHAGLHDVQEAQRAFDAAVAKVNRDLKQDPAYQQAEAKKQEAAQKVESARATDPQPAPSAATTRPSPISPALVQAAEQKLNAAEQVTAIESDRAQADPAVIEAREKLEAATERLNGMKAKFDAALNADPQWQAARQKLDAAKAEISR
jgi:hypothetical protein